MKLFPPPTPPRLLPSLLLVILISYPTFSVPAPTPAPAPPVSNTTSSSLNPDQIKALQSLGIPTLKDPCTNPGKHHTVTCATGKPYKFLTSLKLMNCASDIILTTSTLESLSTLLDLQFTDCPISSPSSFPPSLQSNLQSFTCINSLKKVMAFNLGKMVSLTTLTVSDVPVISDSGPVVIFGNLKHLKSATITNTNLTGKLPIHWHTTLTHLDLSHNNLTGRIPTTLPSHLERLITLDLSSNKLSGTLPSTLGNLMFLKTLSLSSNKISGPIPDMSALPALVTVNFSTNQLNGTIPKYLSKMVKLKYLNLQTNNFRGILPFNEKFIKSLDVFKVNDNSNLCYNKTQLSSKMKLGIAACDKDGLPVSPPSESVSPSDYDYDEGEKEDEQTEKSGGGKGPNKVVLGVAVGLSSLLFLIIFLVVLAKCCS